MEDIIEDLKNDPDRHVEVAILGPVALDAAGHPDVRGDIVPIPYSGTLSRLLHTLVAVLGDDTEICLGQTPRTLLFRGLAMGLAISVVGLDLPGQKDMVN